MLTAGELVTEQDSYERLKAAICIQAVKDIERGLEFMMENYGEIVPDEVVMSRRFDPKFESPKGGARFDRYLDAKRFFLGPWYLQLSYVPGEYIISSVIKKFQERTS